MPQQATTSGEAVIEAVRMRGGGTLEEISGTVGAPEAEVLKAIARYDNIPLRTTIADDNLTPVLEVRADAA
jgi:hypothetical protein